MPRQHVEKTRKPKKESQHALKSSEATFADKWANFKDKSQRDRDREEKGGRNRKRKFSTQAEKRKQSPAVTNGGSTVTTHHAGGDAVSSALEAFKKQKVAIQ